MSRHGRPGPEPGEPLPQIPLAPDPAQEAATTSRRSPYAAQQGQAPDSMPGLDAPAAIPQIERAPLDGVSVASVVTGAVGLGPVAIALGAVGLRRTTTQWRRSPAIAGVGLGLGILGTLGWAGLAVAAGLGAFSGPDLTATPGDVSAPRTVHASALAAGNCIETLPPQQEVGEVHLVPCAEPHLAQVLETADFPSETYPGQDPALEAAAEWCSTILTERGFSAEAFLPWAIVPTPAAWDEDVRTMSCSARSLLGPTTGDLA